MRIWDNDKLQLRPGMTVHVVPGFGDLGGYHLVLSDTALLTKTGSKVVTNSPRDVFTA